MKPKYMMIYDTIVKQLDEGVYKVGDALPTEVELCEIFDASRMTVSKVILMLVQENRLKRIRGKGTFVTKNLVDKEIVKLTSFSEDMRSLGKVPGAKLLEYSMTYDVSDKLKNILELEEDHFVHTIKRIRTADGEPIAYDVDNVSSRVVPTIDVKKAKDSFYDYLEKNLDLTVASSDLEIKAILANETISKHLGIEIGDPVILLKHITFTEEGLPFEYCATYYRADKYSFRVKSFR